MLFIKTHIKRSYYHYYYLNNNNKVANFNDWSLDQITVVRRYRKAGKLPPLLQLPVLGHVRATDVCPKV